MTPFVDGTDAWNVKLSVHQLIRVRDALNAQLDNFFDDEELRLRLQTDDVWVSEIMWVLIEEQAIEKGITREQYLHRMAGDVLDTQYEALWKELINFFRGPHRKAVQEMWEAIQERRAAIAAGVGSGSLSGESQALSESILAPST